MKTFITTNSWAQICRGGEKTICIAHYMISFFVVGWSSVSAIMDWGTWQPVHYLYRVYTLHPCSCLHPLLHPLVRPTLIRPLISTLIPVLFQEHRDCLMIYWPDLSIRTVNHNGPSTKEEPVGHALLSYVLPLCPLPPSSFAANLHPLRFPITHRD